MSTIRSSLPRRVLRREPWENAAVGLIALGVFMLMQPFWLLLYTYSFVVTAVGTLLFMVATKFPD